MSAILLPDRRIVLPGRRPDPAGTLRRWWDRLRVLAFQRYDVGGCDCHCGEGCSGGGAPCTLPATDLALTKSMPSLICPDQPFAYTLAYGGNCNWVGPCETEFCSGVDQFSVFIMGLTPGGCFYAADIPFSDAGCDTPGAYRSYQSPAGCANATIQALYPGSSDGGAMTSHSFSCEPLSLVFVNGSFTWTVTP